MVELSNPFQKNINTANGRKPFNTDAIDLLSSTTFDSVPAEVIDIILNSSHPLYESDLDIGTITFRSINSFNSSANDVGTAIPKNPYIKIYPLKHEVVTITKSLSINSSVNQGSVSYYYDYATNIWNGLNQNSLPYSTRDVTLDNKQDPTQFTGNQPTTNNSDSLISLGDTFKESKSIQQVQPYEGDIINYGRWGQSIRFSSTVPQSNNTWSLKGSSGDPITIIRNHKSSQNSNFTIEDITNDDNSIYLCSGQLINLKLSSTNFKSFGINSTSNTYKSSYNLQTPDQYANNQVIINSDRILFNARNDSVIFAAKQAIGLSSNGTINFDSTGPLIANCDKYYFGIDAKEQGLLGNKSTTLLNNFITEVTKLQVITPMGPMPISPDNIANLQKIASQLKSLLSQTFYLK